MTAIRIGVTELVRLGVVRALNYLRNKGVPARDRGLPYRWFHSQFGEDRYIHEHLCRRSPGVFVDVGAGDPVRFSNTFFFERNGWRGICIDANPDQCERLRACRSLVEWAAVGTREGEVDFHRASDPNESSTLPVRAGRHGEKCRVPASRLETLLEKHRIEKIDLLDIDVEGTELDVWRSFDHERHRPSVVILEYLTWGLGDASAEIRSCFVNLPYRLALTTPTNLVFVRTGDN